MPTPGNKKKVTHKYKCNKNKMNVIMKKQT